MSNREISTELAEAVIDLVQECEYTVDDWHATQPTWTPERIDGVKPAIAKVIDLLAVEVARDLTAAIQDAERARERGEAGE